MSDPRAIEEVHLDYFRAGAAVATTASYQATIPGLEAAGLDRAEAVATIRRSVALAQRARERFVAQTGTDRHALQVAGSVGPYGAMLADGSEYRGDYDPGDAALRDVHGPRIEALRDAGADVIAFETIPTMREARVLVGLARETGVHAWLSYQCRDEHATAAGEPIEEAVAVANDVDAIDAVGVNCTAPDLVPALLAAARSATDRPFIAYPNRGDRWDPATRTWVPSGPSHAYDPVVVAGWTALGANRLGGCCGTGPDDIARLAAAAEVSRRGGDPSPSSSAR
jgi:homocysteine S-methyltransferase